MKGFYQKIEGDVIFILRAKVLFLIYCYSVFNMSEMPF